MCPRTSPEGTWQITYAVINAVRVGLFWGDLKHIFVLFCFVFLPFLDTSMALSQWLPTALKHFVISVTQVRPEWVKKTQLTHWGRVTHVCVGKLTIIGLDNGRRQAIIWTNAGIFLFGPLGSYLCEIVIEIDTFSLKKMHLKLSSAEWRPSCLGLNVLRVKIYFKVLYSLYLTDKNGITNHCLVEVPYFTL